MQQELWIETFTGKKVNPLRLTEEDIDILDIAHALSMICRFGGHCRRFYSVGQHSLYVCRLLEEKLAPVIVTEKRLTLLAGLLHDSAEAYIADVTSPVKYQIRQLREIEDRALGVIMKKFGVVGANWVYIKDADTFAIAAEAKALMHSKGVDWNLPKVGDYLPLYYDTSPIKVEAEMLTMWQRLRR